MDITHGNPLLSWFSRQFCFLYLRERIPELWNEWVLLSFLVAPWCLFQHPYGCPFSSQTGLCNWLLSRFFLRDKSSRLGGTTGNGRRGLFGMHPLLFYSSASLLYVSWASSEVGSRINTRKIGISSAAGTGNVISCDRDGGRAGVLRNHLCSPLLLLALFFNFLFIFQVPCSWASAPGQFFRV